ncbi:MAG: DUF4625 domain-containing protein [Bacteroidales bacterium]|nr:DUF4625 domain-containing protein [Bacteroidales bacterium]
MKNIQLVIFLLSTTIIFFSCNKEKEVIDKQKPNIDFSIQDAFPLNCDTLYFGETFNFKVLFSDNVELGSFSIDIHQNFDHHSHSTEATTCNSDPIKTPINPYSFIQDYAIPAGLKQYEPNLSITIPANNENGLFDEGDYHFLIMLTDQSGWSTQKGLSIKILNRNS